MQRSARDERGERDAESRPALFRPWTLTFEFYFFNSMKCERKKQAACSRPDGAKVPPAASDRGGQIGAGRGGGEGCTARLAWWVASYQAHPMSEICSTGSGGGERGKRTSLLGRGDHQRRLSLSRLAWIGPSSTRTWPGKGQDMVFRDGALDHRFFGATTCEATSWIGACNDARERLCSALTCPAPFAVAAPAPV